MKVSATNSRKPSLERKVDTLIEGLNELSRRQRVYSTLIAGAMIAVLMSSSPSLALYRLLVEHFRLEAFVNGAFVALLGGLTAAFIGWACRAIGATRGKQ